jgi:hypothetical protein
MPTGLVFLQLEEVAQARNPFRRHVTWLGATTVHRPDRKGLSRVELDALFLAKLTQAFRDCAPELVVLEEPIDARPHWQRQKAGRTGAERFELLRAKGEDRRAESGETRFRQGVYYFAAVAAALDAGARVVSYPVRGRKGEPGWQGRATRQQLELSLHHDVTRWEGPLELQRPRPRPPKYPEDGAAQAPSEPTKSLDHQLMALGVLVHHLRQTLNLVLWP